MGNCISSEDTADYYKPLLVNKDAEIESLNTYIANLQLQLNYYSTHKDDIHKKYFDLSLQEFTNLRGNDCIEFPHNFFKNYSNINYSNLETIFTVFENIFSKNHLENINYKMRILVHMILNLR